jgi:hypothetical protein
LPGGRRRAIAESPRLRRAARTCNGTRRVEPIPTEQQDRLPEHLGAACGELGWATRCLHESNQALRRLASLLGSRPSHIRHRRRHRANPPRELRRHRGPTMKQRALRSVPWRSTRSVPIQPLDVEHTRSESEHPDLDGACYDARGVGDARQRDLVDKSLPHRIQNHVDAGNFPWQRLERKHPLAMPTIATTCERHLEHHGCVADVQSALDSAPSKS